MSNVNSRNVENMSCWDMLKDPMIYVARSLHRIGILDWIKSEIATRVVMATAGTIGCYARVGGCLYVAKYGEVQRHSDAPSLYYLALVQFGLALVNPVVASIKPSVMLKIHAYFELTADYIADAKSDLAREKKKLAEPVLKQDIEEKTEVEKRITADEVELEGLEELDITKPPKKAETPKEIKKVVHIPSKTASRENSVCFNLFVYAAIAVVIGLVLKIMPAIGEK